MADVPASHRDLLQADVATLATVGGDGRPQLSEVWFLAEDDALRPPTESGPARRLGAPAEQLPRLDPRRRLVALPARAGPLPPLCVAGLPMGAPHRHRAPAEAAGRRRDALCRRSPARRARLG